MTARDDLTWAEACLPHPSGRCREWNKPGAWARARETVKEMLARSRAAV